MNPGEEEQELCKVDAHLSEQSISCIGSLVWFHLNFSGTPNLIDNFLPFSSVSYTVCYCRSIYMATALLISIIYIVMF